MGREGILKLPSGERVSLAEWAVRNGVNADMVRSRWYNMGIRDPKELVAEATKRWEWDPSVDEIPPHLTEEQKADLLWLAQFSMGQEDQKYILCDFVPCSHYWADLLMEELGLA